MRMVLALVMVCVFLAACASQQYIPSNIPPTPVSNVTAPDNSPDPLLPAPGNEVANPPDDTPDVPQAISEQELGAHTAIDDCWIVSDGNVYDISGYLPGHINATILSRCGLPDDISHGLTGKDAGSVIGTLIQQGTQKGRLQ